MNDAQIIPWACCQWTVRRVTTGDAKPHVEILLNGVRADSPGMAVHLLLDVGSCESLLQYVKNALDQAKKEAGK